MTVNILYSVFCTQMIENMQILTLQNHLLSREHAVFSCVSVLLYISAFLAQAHCPPVPSCSFRPMSKIPFLQF